MKVIQLHKDENTLLKKAIANDRQSQHQLYELFAPKMLSVCRQYIADIHHAEDVMLTAFMKVFKHLKNFRNEGSFEGWIRRIMIRESVSFLRKQKRVEFFTDELPESNNTVIVAESHLAVNDIQRIIDELPEGYRIVFLMYAVEGFKHREIAEELKISVNTSKTQLFKARRLLQQKIQNFNTRDHGTR